MHIIQLIITANWDLDIRKAFDSSFSSVKTRNIFNVMQICPSTQSTELVPQKDGVDVRELVSYAKLAILIP